MNQTSPLLEHCADGRVHELDVEGRVSAVATEDDRLFGDSELWAKIRVRVRQTNDVRHDRRLSQSGQHNASAKRTNPTLRVRHQPVRNPRKTMAVRI